MCVQWKKKKNQEVKKVVTCSEKSIGSDRAVDDHLGPKKINNYISVQMMSDIHKSNNCLRILSLSNNRKCTDGPLIPLFGRRSGIAIGSTGTQGSPFTWC